MDVVDVVVEFEEDDPRTTTPKKVLLRNKIPISPRMAFHQQRFAPLLLLLRTAGLSSPLELICTIAAVALLYNETVIHKGQMNV